MPFRFETRGPVAVLTLDRPEAMNAIDPETQDRMVAAWERVRDDDMVRVAVLTGSGKAFCAGIDLKRVDEWYARVPADRRREVWDRIPGLGGITRNLDVGKPVLAAVNGACLGGGLELALACDVRWASEGATFALPELKWGILPGQGGTQRLPRLVGSGVALEMILSGEALDARRALELGLVSRVLPAERLLPTMLEFAGAIAQRPARALRHAREAVQRGLELPLGEGLRLEQSLADPLRDDPEGRAAREAFKKRSGAKS